MAKTSKLGVEAQRVKLSQRDEELRKERVIAGRARDEKIERLRALRLAKEAADREEALRSAEKLKTNSKRAPKRTSA